jgi:hypothetical protein
MLKVADLVLENIGAPNWVMQALMLVLAFPASATGEETKTCSA